MAIPAYVSWMLEGEARALLMLTRLARVKSFALQEAMLPAANLLPESQTTIENVLARGRNDREAPLINRGAPDKQRHATD
jgi:hypothetical protein